jgi:hypothetical protein
VVQAYHVKGDHIAERYFASFVALNKILVDQNRAASRRQAKDKGSLWSRIEGFDAFYVGLLVGVLCIRKG